jgi:hypothetical protein
MAWLRRSDDYNLQPEIRALDDQCYRALQCLNEAAEKYDSCGMVPDDYAVAFYPHSRQSFRNKIGKLIDRELVHVLSKPGDRDHRCRSCVTRWEELQGELAEEVRKNWGTSSGTSSGFSKTEPMWLCLRDFFDTALTPTQKSQTKQGNAKRQQKKRDEDKAAESRRDAQPPSHPPVPVPVPDPKLRIIDRVPQSEEPEPRSTASPSEPSSGTADRDAVSWLREELDKRRAACGVSCKWKPEHQEHLESIVQQASEAEGDTFKVLTGGMDAFFKDLDQRKWRFAPPGLAWGFAEYAAPILEQEATEASARKRVEQDEKLAAMDAAILARDAERKAERKANGTPGERGAEPVAIAELMRSIGVKVE